MEPLTGSGATAARGLAAEPEPVQCRPRAAVGEVLRIVTVNDVYKLDNYPDLAGFLRAVRATAAAQRCRVICTLPGDFLSPCVISSIDGGKAMGDALNTVPVDYVCFGNHEFDVGPSISRRVKAFSGKWLNSNISEPAFEDAAGAPLPAFDIVEVGDKAVVLGGFATDTLDIYRPGSNLVIEPPATAMARVWAAACAAREAAGRAPPDAFVPLTHQLIKDDRASLAALTKAVPALRAALPCVLGGHEHEVFVVSEGETLVVKTGADAVLAGIVDVYWDAGGACRAAAALHPLAGWADAPDACACAKFVEGSKALLDQMLGCEIARLPRAMSTTRVRFEMSELATFLLSKVRAALHGCDAALIQGGAVRGKAEYAKGKFTFGDLMKEFAFECEMAVVQLPGRVLAASFRATRAGEGAKPGFLHADDGARFADDDAAALTHLAGAPLEPDKLYTVAIYQFLLGGMNPIAPLIEYVRASGLEVPELERCLPAKNLVLETCVKEAWRRVVGAIGAADGGAGAGAAGEGEGGGTPRHRSFRKLDADGSGKISAAELTAVVKAIDEDDDPDNDVPVELVARMISTIDADGDGEVDYEEFSAALANV